MEELDERVEEIEFLSIHPLETQLDGAAPGRRAQARGHRQERKFVRLQSTSCNPLWSNFRPPGKKNNSFLFVL